MGSGKRYDSANRRLREARFQRAIARPELLRPSTPREAPAGPVSFPTKTVDPETQRLIDEALARRKS